jgi:tRNA nucleotidyltransferase (CCA-adding enzyme)
MMVVDCAARLSPEPETRFAALTHDLGKGVTPREQWPSHRGHDERGVALVDGLCERLKAPNRFCGLARLVARHHCKVNRADELRPNTLLRLLDELDAFRRPERLQQFLLACEADFRGRAGFEDRSYPQAERFRRAQAAAAAVDLTGVAAIAGRPDSIPDTVHRLRLRAIKAADA